MKCPKCKAKLLPVDGEMFCLQCGNAVHAGKGARDDGPALEDTTDPVLQKAIQDTTRRPVHFKLPVSDAKPVPVTTAFTSMRTVLSPSRAALVPSAAIGALASPPVVAPMPEPAREAAVTEKAKVAWRAPSFAWIV